MVQELEAYHAIYAPLFRDEKQRFYAYHYLAGLLDPEIRRKSAENLALATLGPESVRNVQHFVGQSRWRDDAILAEHGRQIGQMLGTSDGVLILDGSDCAKQFVGLNEYETRTWFGWRHHMMLVILAFGFLARCQLRLKSDAPALTVPQVVDLLKAVLPKPDFDAQAAIDLLRYKQMRITRAKRSHYLMQKQRAVDELLVTQ